MLDRGAPKCTLHDRFITLARPSRQVVAAVTPAEKSGHRILSIRPLSRRSTYPHVSPRGTPSPYAAGAHQAPLPSHLLSLSSSSRRVRLVSIFAIDGWLVGLLLFLFFFLLIFLGFAFTFSCVSCCSLRPSPCWPRFAVHVALACLPSYPGGACHREASTCDLAPRPLPFQRRRAALLRGCCTLTTSLQDGRDCREQRG